MDSQSMDFVFALCMCICSANFAPQTWRTQLKTPKIEIVQCAGNVVIYKDYQAPD